MPRPRNHGRAIPRRNSVRERRNTTSKNGRNPIPTETANPAFGVLQHKSGWMKSKLVSGNPAPVHVVILDSGEEAFAALTKFANEEKLSAASLTAIGAFERATVGWFDLASKSYRKIEVNEQCEV